MFPPKLSSHDPSCPGGGGARPSDQHQAHRILYATMAELDTLGTFPSGMQASPLPNATTGRDASPATLCRVGAFVHA
jgi:hypothetical protein